MSFIVTNEYLSFFDRVNNFFYWRNFVDIKFVDTFEFIIIIILWSFIWIDVMNCDILLFVIFNCFRIVKLNFFNIFFIKNINFFLFVYLFMKYKIFFVDQYSWYIDFFFVFWCFLHWEFSQKYQSRFSCLVFCCVLIIFIII